MAKKINFKTFLKNKDKYISQIKNKNLKAYYDILSIEYSFEDDVDFFEFVDIMSKQEDKELCRKTLRKFKELGLKKEYKWHNHLDDYISKEHFDAIKKNEKLICDLADFRINALGIGTNKIKRRLNKLSETNAVAKALRVAIEVEDVNILAKKSFGKYKTKQYDKKSALIFKLVEIFKKNNWTYGVHNENQIQTNYVIFFEIPNTEQISFHTNLSNAQTHPKYNKKWDEKINSTYPKLLESVKTQFPEIIY